MSCCHYSFWYKDNPRDRIKNDINYKDKCEPEEKSERGIELVHKARN